MPYKNKADQAESARRHYLKNTDKLRKRAKRNNKDSREEKTNFVKEYLKKHPCIDCGEADLRVLDFDHVRGEKKDNVSVIRRGANSLRKLMEEIEKCDVRCANCHRKKTHETLWSIPGFGHVGHPRKPKMAEMPFFGTESFEFFG